MSRAPTHSSGAMFASALRGVAAPVPGRGGARRRTGFFSPLSGGVTRALQCVRGGPTAEPSYHPSAVNRRGRRAYFAKDATLKGAAGSVPATALDTQEHAHALDFLVLAGDTTAASFPRRGCSRSARYDEGDHRDRAIATASMSGRGMERFSSKRRGTSSPRLILPLSGLRPRGAAPSAADCSSDGRCGPRTRRTGIRAWSLTGTWRHSALRASAREPDPPALDPSRPAPGTVPGYLPVGTCPGAAIAACTLVRALAERVDDDGRLLIQGTDADALSLAALALEEMLGAPATTGDAGAEAG